MIKDSGNRRKFETGAVRDIQEGKGRCDLMPLDILSGLLDDPIFDYVAAFQRDGDCGHLYVALEHFITLKLGTTFADAMLRVSVHYEEGAKKYGEYNWQKGIPVYCYLDSAVRHYLKWVRGDKDEPHDRAFIWNLLCCIWTVKHSDEIGGAHAKN